MPKLPRLPNPEDALNFIDKAGDVVSKGLELIDRTTKKIDRLAGRIDSVGGLTLETPTRAPVPQAGGPLAATVPQTLSEENPTKDIATGCLPCALGHFSTSSGLLNEAVRFKGEGMASNEILDRIAGALEQQNTLEREDLSPVKIQGLPKWEKPIAEEALDQSRQLRHRLESIQSVDELEQAAVDTKRYYIKLNRQWYKGRFSRLGEKKADAIAQRVGEEP